MDLEDYSNNIPIVAGDELLEAQSHIWKNIFSLNNFMSLKCVVQLGIPDAIHRHGPNPMPLSQLVSALQLHPNKTEFIYRLMRVSVHSGFFSIRQVSENGEKEEGYVLTNSSHLLVKSNPLTLAPFLLSMLEKDLLESWRFVPAWFQSEDRTPFYTAHGMSRWEYMDSKSTDGEMFNAAMASDAKLVISILIEKYKGVFDGIGSLVDVGGGTGTVAKAIVEAFPQMECSVLDLPQVVADLKGEGNLKYVEGDMFEAIPPADAFLLKSTLHDWSDEECVKILKKCKEAMKSKSNEKKGKVIVIDMVVGNQTRHDLIETQLFIDITMMLVVGGKERDEKEWAQLIQQAGFSGYKIFPILGLNSLIEIYP